MLRPIQITPITDQTPIRQTLIPNTMTDADYLANQFASGNYAQPTAMAVARPMPQPVSPVADLAQTAQTGLQGAERISKQIAKSPRVQGLLGGGESTGGLLGDIQGQSALQGLFATMQAIGRPVRRGEDRYLGAVQYGQQVMDAAQKRGMQDLSTQMQLDKYQREVARKEKEMEMLQGIGQTAVSEEMMSQVDYLPEANQQLFATSLRYEALAQQYASQGLSEKASEFASLAKSSRDAAFAGQIDPEKRTTIELSEGEKFFKNEYEDRYASVNSYNEMVKQAETGGGISDYALLIKYIKVLDPTSVVREGEVTMTDQFKGYESRFNELLKRAQGLGFDDQFRRSLLDSARRNAQLAADEYEAAVERKSSQLLMSGLRPARVITVPSLTLLGQETDAATQAADAASVDEIIQQYTSGN